VPTTINEKKAALDLQHADINDFDTTDSHQMNFDLIESEDDVKAIIGQMAEVNKLEITEARRGVIGDEQLKALANDIGGDPDFIRTVMERGEGQLLSPEHVLATRQVVEQSAVQLKELSAKISTGNATERERLAFSKQWNFHREFTNQFMGMRAEYGRGLRAFGIPQGSDQVQLDRINEMMQRVHSGLDVDAMANQIMVSPTTNGITSMVRAQDGLFKKASNVFLENFINSILSGVKTHVINASGSALRMGMDTADTFVAARIGKNLPNPQEKVALDEWKAGLFGLQNGFMDAMNAAGQVMKTAEPFGGVNKLETMGQRYITSDYLGAKQGSVSGTAIDAIGTVIRFPTERLMGSMDGFFKSIAQQQKIAQVAFREASNMAKQNNLGDKEAQQLLADMMKNPTPEMIEEAVDYSLAVSFQTPLGKFGQKIQNTIYSNPLTTYIVPFVRTPTNLMKQAFLERTPLAYLTKEYQQAIAEGGAKGQTAKAKLYVGNTMSMMAGMWAANGQITGSDPSDFKQREAKHATGWRPNSIVVSNPDGTKDYISYQRLEPFSYLFGSIADFTDIMQRQEDMKMGEETEHYADRIAASWAIAISNSTLDRTFMTGVRDLMTAMSDPKRYMSSYMARQANANVPFSGLRRDATRVMDDTKRMTDGYLDKIKQSTPGFSADLPHALDAYGEIIEYDAVMNPWAYSEGKDDEVISEVQRLAESTQMVAVTKPSRMVSGLKLEAKDYHKLIKLSRKDLEVNGKNFKATLNDVIRSEAYNEAIDEDKVEQLARVRNAYDKAAKVQLMTEDPDLMRRIIKRRTAKAAKYAARNEGIPEEEASSSLVNEIMLNQTGE